MVPDLQAKLAHSEHELSNSLNLQNSKSSLNDWKREVINLVISQVNDYTYCLAAYTVLGGMVGFTSAQIITVRQDDAAVDTRRNALAKLVRSATLNRG